MICHICAQPAIGQCKTCLKFYCAAHGDQLCQQCKAKLPMGHFSPTFAQTVLTSSSIGSGNPAASHSAKLTEGVPERVLGVGKTIQADGFQIVLLSVELYRDGFVANFRLIGERPMFPMIPGLSIEATDSIGNQYDGQAGSGTGTGQMWQTAFPFGPAVPSNAKGLRLTVREITVRGPGIEYLAPLVKGPWVFDVERNAIV